MYSVDTVCLKCMSRTISLQGLTLEAITAAEKHTLILALRLNNI